MTVRACALLASSMLLGTGVSTQAQPPAPTAITNVTIVDVLGGRELAHHTILIRGDRIAEIRAASSDRTLPSNATRIDGRGHWLIPGLWDMHMHALTDHRYTYFFPLLIAHGVTAVREMGSNLPAAEINEIRRDVDSGKLLGPHFAAATFRLLDGPGTKFRNAVVLSTPQQARSVVREQHRNGSDFAKTYNLLPRATYFAVVDEAHRLGEPVEGHIPFSISAFEAARVGQRSFEHNFGVTLALSSDEASLRRALTSGKDTWGHVEARAATSWDEAKAQRLFGEMRRRGVWSCPTIAFYRIPILIGRSAAWAGQERYRYVPQWAFRDWARSIDQQMGPNLTIPELRQSHFATLQRLTREMYHAGIPILAGTDSGAVGGVAGFSLHDELGELVEAGLRPIDALRSATIVPARFAHEERVSGSIGVGKRADLVLLNADPLANINNSRRIAAVIRAGHLYDRTALDALLERARQAAAAATKPADIADD
jgi:cytosine/adenosine deaminase-related metal-dependent hydrolase